MIIEEHGEYTIRREHGLFDAPKQKSLLTLYRDEYFVACGEQRELHQEMQEDCVRRARAHRQETERTKAEAEMYKEIDAAVTGLILKAAQKVGLLRA